MVPLDNYYKINILFRELCSFEANRHLGKYMEWCSNDPSSDVKVGKFKTYNMQWKSEEIHQPDWINECSSRKLIRVLIFRGNILQWRSLYFSRSGALWVQTQLKPSYFVVVSIWKPWTQAVRKALYPQITVKSNSWQKNKKRLGIKTFF